MKIGFQPTVLQFQHTSNETISKHELLDKGMGSEYTNIRPLCK